jgi:hypothetical protein
VSDDQAVALGFPGREQSAYSRYKYAKSSDPKEQLITFKKF